MAILQTIFGAPPYTTTDLKIDNTDHNHKEKGTSEGWYHMKTKLPSKLTAKIAISRHKCHQIQKIEITFTYHCPDSWILWHR